MSPKLTLYAILGVIALIIASSSLYIVPQTGQALVLRFGKPDRVIKEPGLKAKVPLLEQVEMFDNRLLEFNAEEKEVIASDQKRLIVDAFVRYRITDPLKFKQSVGNEYTMQSRLSTIIESSLRQAIASTPLSSIIAVERNKIMQRVRDTANHIAAGHVSGDVADVTAPRGGFGIEVVDVRIVRTDLPQANSETIYRQMQTEREREVKEFRARGAEDAQIIRATADKERSILLAEARKKSEITRGEGDSEAIKVFAEATSKSPEFYEFYRTMQAYIKALDQHNTTLVMTPESEFLRFFEDSQPKK